MRERIWTDLRSDGGSEFGGDGAYGGAGTVLAGRGGEDEGDVGEERSVESGAHHVDCGGVGWVMVLMEVMRRRGGDCWLVDGIVDEGVAAELEENNLRGGGLYTQITVGCQGAITLKTTSQYSPISRTL